jgi:hypothetical protein
MGILPKFPKENNMSIQAIITDSREPDWVKQLDYGVPNMDALMETGDLQILTDDSHMLTIERKTPDDFLGSLKDGRLMAQMARLAEDRHFDLIRDGKSNNWAYLVISGMYGAQNGRAVTERGVTGWGLASVYGAILSIQEMGVFVVFCDGDANFKDCIIKLADRKRTEEQQVLPPRPGVLLGPKVAFLAGLPGIGIERAQDILDWSKHNVGHALMGLTDVQIKAPVPVSVRWNIRHMLGLEEGDELIISKGEKHV